MAQLRFSLRALLTLTTLVAIGLGVFVLGARAFQPPIALAKLALVKTGMTQSQVRQILGKPPGVSPAINYTVKGKDYYLGEVWVYERSLTFGWIEVGFDKSEVVEFTNYEQY